VATSCIESMQNNTPHSVNEISLKQLRKATRANLSAFQISLFSSNDILVCHDIIRILPGKRVVAFGKWGSKSVVAKIFYEPRNAARHALRDAVGIKALLNAGVLTPPLFYQGTADDKNIHILIFEKIEGYSLDSLWEHKVDVNEMSPLLHAVTIELATQHVLGVLQHDLHFKNFIVRRKNIFTLDGGDIEIFDKPLGKKESLDNLALFFSQLGVDTHELQQYLFQTYTRARGWLVKERDIFMLQSALEKWNRKRLRQFSKKIMRNSSSFVRYKKPGSLVIYDRDYETAELLEFLKNPEALFSAAQILKDGGSSTVIKIRLGKKIFVLKRYSLKNFLHWLRRCLRQTRAAKSWKFAQRLRLLGIPTAKPVGFIEKSFLGLRGQSYLLMEYVEGVTLGEHFAKDSETQEIVAKRVISLFENLARLRITHGDLKMTNILIHDQAPTLIDLDGMQMHRTTWTFKRSFQDEIARFLRNWQHQPSLLSLFSKLIKEMFQRQGI